MEVNYECVICHSGWFPSIQAKTLPPPFFMLFGWKETVTALLNWVRFLSHRGNRESYFNPAGINAYL